MNPNRSPGTEENYEVMSRGGGGGGTNNWLQKNGAIPDVSKGLISNKKKGNAPLANWLCHMMLRSACQPCEGHQRPQNITRGTAKIRPENREFQCSRETSYGERKTSVHTWVANKGRGGAKKKRSNQTSNEKEGLEWRQSMEEVRDAEPGFCRGNERMQMGRQAGVQAWK